MFFGGKIDKWGYDDFGGEKPSGAARGQSGGGGKAGSQRTVFAQYEQLSPEEKRAAAKKRRLAKKGALPQADRGETEKRVLATLKNIQRAVEALIPDNDPGHLTFKTDHANFSLEVHVKAVGAYRFLIDDGTGTF